MKAGGNQPRESSARPAASSTALSSAELVDAFIPVYTLAAPAVLVSMYQASLPPEVSLYEKIKEEASAVSKEKVEAVPSVTSLETVTEEPVVETEAVPVTSVAVEVTKEEEVKVEVAPAVMAATSPEAISETSVATEPVAETAMATTSSETSDSNPNIVKGITQLLRALYFPWLGMVPRFSPAS